MSTMGNLRSQRGSLKNQTQDLLTKINNTIFLFLYIKVHTCTLLLYVAKLKKNTTNIKMLNCQTVLQQKKKTKKKTYATRICYNIFL